MTDSQDLRNLMQTTYAVIGGTLALLVATGAILPALAADRLDTAIQKEQERGRALESDVERELRRQEELLRSIDRDKATERELEAAAVQEVNLLERANMRIAPRAPVDRTLPVSIFDSETIEIPAKRWGNNRKQVVLKRSLDADRDGKPEQIRYLDPQTGQMIRKEWDRDYDGVIDSYQTYAGGAVNHKEIDSDGDGRIDQWERFSRGRMTEREIDRDANGRKDAFYKYSGDSLVEESHDRDNDGKPDLIVSYRNRHLVKKQEDRTKNGTIDTWISFGIHSDRELPIRIERDTDDSGKVDITEDFDITTGEPIISRREEDRNSDGEIDVISLYKRGKLVKREIRNPDVVDL